MQISGSSSPSCIQSNTSQKEKPSLAQDGSSPSHNSQILQAGSGVLNDNGGISNLANSGLSDGDANATAAVPSIVMVLSELREIKEQVSEIKGIKQQISKLDTIETVTASLSNKIMQVMDRTSEIETAVHSNAARLREYDDQFVSLKATVRKNEKSLSSVKEELSKTKEKSASDINRLFSLQKEQAESLNITTEEASQAILAEVDQRFAKMKRQADFKDLKNQAFNSRNNLILVGLPEDKNKDTSAIVKDFIENTLKIKNAHFDVAYRIGSAPTDPSSSYARPVLVHFPLLPHRNRIWKKRTSVPGDQEDQKVRIHADLPKQLRDDV